MLFCEVLKHAKNLLVYRYASVKVIMQSLIKYLCKYVIAEVCKYDTILVHKDSITMHVCKYESLVTRKYIL